MNKQERALYIKKELAKLYKNPKPPLNFSNPFTLLIAVLLSAQCTDERVNIVTKELFKVANTPKLTPFRKVLETSNVAPISPAKYFP